MEETEEEMRNVGCVVCTVQCTLCSVQCAVCCVQCAVCSVYGMSDECGSVITWALALSAITELENRPWLLFIPPVPCLQGVLEVSLLPLVFANSDSATSWYLAPGYPSQPIEVSCPWFLLLLLLCPPLANHYNYLLLCSFLGHLGKPSKKKLLNP